MFNKEAFKRGFIEKLAIDESMIGSLGSAIGNVGSSAANTVGGMTSDWGTLGTLLGVAQAAKKKKREWAPEVEGAARGMTYGNTIPAGITLGGLLGMLGGGLGGAGLGAVLSGGLGNLDDPQLSKQLAMYAGLGGLGGAALGGLGGAGVGGYAGYKISDAIVNKILDEQKRKEREEEQV